MTPMTKEERAVARNKLRPMKADKAKPDETKNAKLKQNGPGER